MSDDIMSDNEILVWKDWFTVVWFPKDLKFYFGKGKIFNRSLVLQLGHLYIRIGSRY